MALIRGNKKGRYWVGLWVCQWVVLALTASTVSTAFAAGPITGNAGYINLRMNNTVQNGLSTNVIGKESVLSTAKFAFVAEPGWSEGYLWWDCQVDSCAIHSFVYPECNGNFGCWQAGPLPLGHYYWFGSVMVLECQQGYWRSIGGSGLLFFNYDPRKEGDQAAVEGGVCGSYIDPNLNFGKPDTCPAL